MCMHTTRVLDVLPVYGNVDIGIWIHQIKMKTPTLVAYTHIRLIEYYFEVNRESSRDSYIRL